MATIRRNSIISALYRPWIVRACRIRSIPAAVGPVLLPPCIRHREFLIAATGTTSRSSSSARPGGNQPVFTIASIKVLLNRSDFDPPMGARYRTRPRRE
jgi:hypothetical protein